jgi:signal transduction histidine kinase
MWTSFTERRRLLDAALSLVAFVLTLAIAGSGGPGDEDAHHLSPLGVLVAGVASLPLAFLRRAPLALFALMTVASATLNLLGSESGPPPGPTIALFLIAARADESRARSWVTAGVVIASFLVHLASRGIEEDRIPPEALFFGILVWGGAWVLGDRLRQRRARLREQDERVRRSQRDAERERRLAAAEERTRIARDLHDSAGHAINVILVQAGAARLLQDRDPDGARKALATVEEVARETVGEIDRLVRVLREDDGRPTATTVEPPPGLAALPALIDRHRLAGLDVSIVETGQRRPLPPAVDQAAYRILQESLTNAARHGKGGAAVRLDFRPDALELSIENDFEGTQSQGGLGIVGMRERIGLVGGEFEAGSEDGRFRVRARLPYGAPV